MSRWTVEYSRLGKGWDFMSNIEATDGAEAIEYVKRHVDGVFTKFKCYREDDTEVEI